MYQGGGLRRSSFINTVPFTDAMAAGEERRGVRLRNEAAEFQMGEQQRLSAEQQATDAAIRAGLPQAQQQAPAATPPAAPAPQQQTIIPPQPGTGQAPVTTQPLAAGPTPAVAAGPAVAQAQPAGQNNLSGVQAQLAKTPGGGRLALALAQAEQKRRDDDEANVMRFLSNPNTAHLGSALAQKIGMQLPEQLVSNTNFWTAASIGKDLYGDDHASAQKFTAAFTQLPSGDIQQRVQAAVQAAGLPVKKKRYGHVDDGGNIQFYNLENPSDRIAMPKVDRGTLQYGEDGSMFRVAGNTASPVTIEGTNTPLKGQKFRPSAGAAANVLVKIGQNSGKLYPADYEGQGDAGEAIVAMPAAAAARIAVAKGNNATQITLREMIGDTQLAVQDQRNQGAVATQQTRNEGNQAVAGIRSDAQIGSAQIGAQSRTDAAKINQDTRLGVEGVRGTNAKDVAEIRGGTARDVAETNRAGRENSAKTAADARKGAGAGGRQSVFEQKRQAALAAGMTPQEALKYANGLKQITPQQEERMALDMAKKLSDAEMMPKGEQWVTNKQQEILAGWRGGKPAAGAKPAPAAQGQPPAAQAAPAQPQPQAQGGASPYPDYPQARQAPDGNWYTPNPDKPGGWLRIKEGGQ